MKKYMIISFHCIHQITFYSTQPLLPTCKGLFSITLLSRYPYFIW